MDNPRTTGGMDLPPMDVPLDINSRASFKYKDNGRMIKTLGGIPAFVPYKVRLYFKCLK